VAAVQALQATVVLVALAATMALVAAVVVLAIAHPVLLVVLAALVAQALSLLWSGKHEAIQRNYDCGH
jgi:hypothetical protein